MAVTMKVVFWDVTHHLVNMFQGSERMRLAPDSREKSLPA
jgi:hypothetical protein